MSDSRKAKTIGLTFFLFIAFAVYLLAQSSGGNHGSTVNLAAPGPIGGTTPSTGAFTTLTATGEIDSGANGGAAGVYGLFGSTSGKATFTAPAVAGTATNPITITNVLATSEGSNANPSYGSSLANRGLYFTSTDSGKALIEIGTTDIMAFSAGNGPTLRSDFGLGWGSTTNINGATTWDTAISRSAAGVLAVGTSNVAGNTTGKLKASAYMSAGTTFTSNAGCTESALAGGATAGKFTVGQATACTIIITMGNSATAPNGWTCTAYDQTAVPAAAIRQSATTTTTCSLSMTVATNDVIVFSAIGW